MSKKLSLPQEFNPPLILKVGARGSPLSKIQVEEVCGELSQHYRGVELDVEFVKTIGDRDQKTSLMDLGTTDFFTKEIDELLLNKKCRIAIHSAKDLPDPMPQGLSVIAITKGVDPSDALVIRSGFDLKSLPKNPCIGVSSRRRIEAIQEILPGAICKGIRGTIEKRLEQLDDTSYDGVVIAMAALIRLGLTHRNYILLEGDVPPLQGKLAVVARSDDKEMEELFQPLDSRELALH